ncbi:hypothetical protein EGR_04667 [Echinococcus granulosus]|uniref:Uncharacterized protein n=1 Tax=Echinococcus granulosus TaxID=6210 RepID=W6UHD2_ECHGR|nr:hypothetical protein EGR_04667 [Echinococcus granulosus]EUB60473.1 hypothetical protein EGR_04667 [Echinococcus granulosus]
MSFFNKRRLDLLSKNDLSMYILICKDYIVVGRGNFSYHTDRSADGLNALEMGRLGHVISHLKIEILLMNQNGFDNTLPSLKGDARREDGGKMSTLSRIIVTILADNIVKFPFGKLFYFLLNIFVKAFIGKYTPEVYEHNYKLTFKLNFKSFTDQLFPNFFNKVHS